MAIVTIPGNPGDLAKNQARVAYRGKQAPCRACGKPQGSPFVAQAKLPKRVTNDLVDQACAAMVKPIKGMVAVAVLAHWPRQWGPKGRAEGRPLGDVDAPVSNLLDALAGILYGDDAQVALLIAANAKAAKGEERIEASVAHLPHELLVAIEKHTGLPFSTAALSVGEQGRLLP